ncbi:cold-shock protein [Cohnella sp. WQ 127256]|uniref:cold-shock protein n=1 Tax=Cohnella sp. WQ 127256 TaxID=2938790 RepID=UPI002117675E|nr:cold-shock protein [Cohnella sp. WQ 127256]
MYSRKKVLEEIPEEMTAVWSCTSEGCNGWMRDNFAFETVPTCGLCHKPMESGMKMLPLLVNTNRDQKTLRKGVSIG